MAVLLAYLALARRYFFSVPFRGVALACVLYASGGRCHEPPGRSQGECRSA
jgi:hypothetical protein